MTNTELAKDSLETLLEPLQSASGELFDVWIKPDLIPVITVRSTGKVFTREKLSGQFVVDRLLGIFSDIQDYLIEELFWGSPVPASDSTAHKMSNAVLAEEGIVLQESGTHQIIKTLIPIYDLLALGHTAA